MVTYSFLWSPNSWLLDRQRETFKWIYCSQFSFLFFVNRCRCAGLGVCRSKLNDMKNYLGNISYGLTVKLYHGSI